EPHGSPQESPTVVGGLPRGRASPLRALADLALSAASESLPLPSSALAVWSLVAYTVVTILSGGVTSVGLASLPLVSAAVLPGARAVWFGAATVVLTFIPLVLRPATDVIAVATVAELAVLVIAAFAVRASIVRLVRTRSVLFDSAHTTAARMAVIQAASARMNRQGSVESV